MERHPEEIEVVSAQTKARLRLAMVLVTLAYVCLKAFVGSNF